MNSKRFWLFSLKSIPLILLFTSLVPYAYSGGTSGQDPPAGMTLPVFAAPTLVEQKDLNCDYPETRCDGVTVIFNTMANSDYNPIYMNAVYL